MQTYSNPMLNDGLKTKEIKGEKSKERERERGREGKDGDFSFRFRRIAFFSLSVANKDLVGWKWDLRGIYPFLWLIQHLAGRERCGGAGPDPDPEKGVSSPFPSPSPSPGSLTTQPPKGQYPLLSLLPLPFSKITQNPPFCVGSEQALKFSRFHRARGGLITGRRRRGGRRKSRPITAFLLPRPQRYRAP